MPNLLEEKYLDVFLRRIKERKCSLFIGAGACREKFHIESHIANGWAEKYDYLMEVFFDELEIQAYCQDCRKFATELRTRWEAFNRGA